MNYCSKWSQYRTYAALPWQKKPNDIFGEIEYHLEMVKGDGTYLIYSKTINYHNLNPKIKPPQNWESCTSQWQLFTVLAIISNNQ